jgi:hypothetical protein
MTGAPGSRGGGVDLRFVWRGVGRGYLLGVALIPCAIAWTLTPLYGVLLAAPLILAFFTDREEFPVWAAGHGVPPLH